MDKPPSLFLILILILLTACASSQDKSPSSEEYSNLVPLTLPDTMNVDPEPSTIYIDSAIVIQSGTTPALLILGTFPDGCTQIGSADHTAGETGLSLEIGAWRDPETMCTQALVEFSFIYRDIPVELLRNAGSIWINRTTYGLTHR